MRHQPLAHVANLWLCSTHLWLPVINLWLCVTNRWLYAINP
jgi:hypothetical protein